MVNILTRASDSRCRCRKRNYTVSIKRLFDAVERGGDIGWRVAALVLPISNRPGVTPSCAGKIGLRQPSEHTSGANLASRDNVAHNQTLYDSTNATGHPALSKAGPDTSISPKDAKRNYCAFTKAKPFWYKPAAASACH